MKKLYIASLFTSILASTSLNAQSYDIMDPITVVATKSEQSTFDVPSMVDVVDIESQPELGAASTLDDLLADSAAVDFQGSPRRNGQNILMRGFDKDSILVTVDGVRQNFNSGHDGDIFIDPSLLKRVDIVRGANSPLYGSGGLGGVVALQTVDAYDLLRDGQDMGAQVTFGYQSVNEEFSTSLTGYAANDKYDILGSLTLRQSNDIELGDGSEIPSDDEVLSGMLKLGFTPADGHEIKLQYIGYQNDATEPNNPTQYGAVQMVNKDTQSHSFKLEYSYESPKYDWLKPNLIAYYNDVSVEEDELTSEGNDPAGSNKSREVSTIGLHLSNQSYFETKSLAHTLTYGVEYYKDEQDGSNNANADGEYGQAPDAEAEFLSAYIQDEISIDLPKGELLLIPGIRIDDYESNDENGNSQDDSEFSPKFAATYKPNDNYMVYASYAEAFRAPNLSQLYPYGLHFAAGPFANNFTVNPQLKPESGKTFEVGGGIMFDNVITDSDSVRVKAAHYRTTAKDFIDQSVIGYTLPFCSPPMIPCSAGSTIISNVGKAKISGFEIEAVYENEYLRATASYSRMDGKDKITGNYINSIIPETLNTTIIGKLPQYDLELGWRASYVDHHNKVSPSDNQNGGDKTRDGYGVHGIFANWSPNDRIKLSAGVDNLFDREYSRVFAESIEAGRNFKIQATLKW